MQNLSATDLMSLELGFQTAREDVDEETVDEQRPREFSRQCKPDDLPSPASSVAYAIRNESFNGSLTGPEDVTSRRMSCGGAERANKWRRSSGKTRQFRTTNSISWLTSDDESGDANNAHLLSPSVQIQYDTLEGEEHNNQQQRQQQGAVNVDDGEANSASRGLATDWRRPEIRIHVDTCSDSSSLDSLDNNNNNREPRADGRPIRRSRAPFGDHQTTNAPPPSRSSSSVDLRSLERKISASSYWSDCPTYARSASDMQTITSNEQDLLLLSVTRPQDPGSLSDGCYKLTKYCRKNKHYPLAGPYSKFNKFNKSRFDTWKRTNKLITNIHENPSNLHLDCLDRFEALDKAAAKLVAEEEKPTDLQRQEQELESKPPIRKISMREKTTQTPEESPATSAEEQQQQQQKQQQQQQPSDLSNYANNLTHLYKKNRESMDSSSDFRALLYNIICCLLVQDKQVLSTVSVGKMLDVIRTHLDSASRVYAATSNQLLSDVSRQQQLEQGKNNEAPISSGVTQNDGPLGGNQSNVLPRVGSNNRLLAGQQQEELTTMFVNQLVPPASPGHPHKPANFRRISSVSYNDEQLIKDLRDSGGTRQETTGSDSLSTGSNDSQLQRYQQRKQQQQQQQHNNNYQQQHYHQQPQQQREQQPSLWAYRELSDKRQCSLKHLDSVGSSSLTNNTQAQYTSQSSLEQTINHSDGHQNDLTNDSGNGTMCDSQVVSDFAEYESRQRFRPRRASLQTSDRAAAMSSLCCESLKMVNNMAGLTTRGGRFHLGRRMSDFRPMQQPSYMSTDDYLSSTNNNNNTTTTTTTTANNYQRTSFYDDDNSSSLQKCDFASAQRKGSTVAACDDNSNDEDGGRQVDVAGRRAELEWTLNKLINIGLKLTWLTSKDTLKRAIRNIGVPNEIRGKVWLILIDQLIGTKYDAPHLLELASETINRLDEKLGVFDDDTQAILKQIELDVNRTMPGHRLFDDGAEGGVKLRRILVAYSIHVNRAIAYCQGFNFIVALLLSVFEGDETKALRGFICIVDHIFPSKYYFDHYLTGARADQFLLTDFICDQLIKSPTMAERKMVEGVTSSITLNWFISLFHGAVPTLTRLTIIDHFMLEGVKALFKFTMAILYLAFQVTPASSCEIFTTIRSTAKDMFDIKLLLSIVDQIKLPKDSYFAIRRSFYMVQSSFNSDQFYMQTLSNEANRSLVANKPLNCQQLSRIAKPPSLSLISSASFIANATSSLYGYGNQHLVSSSMTGFHTGNNTNHGNQFTVKNSVCQDLVQKPRTRISADRSKICIQSIGKLGRSHLRIIDANTRTNERSLMSPLRNCTIIGITNCGKNLIIARQSSRRNFRCFKEQDLTFHIHEISTEIFDGFYLEEAQQALIITHPGEIFKIDCRKCLEDNKLAKPNYLDKSTETLLLRDTGRSALAENERVKLRLSTMDTLTNLLWIYVESDGFSEAAAKKASSQQSRLPASSRHEHNALDKCSSAITPKTTTKFKFNNPFLEEFDEMRSNLMRITGDDKRNSGDNYSTDRQMNRSGSSNDNLHELEKLQNRHKANSETSNQQQLVGKPSFSRKIIIVDIITFDLFSVFAVHPNFGEITNLRASLVAFCQLSNPMSNQFSTRIVQIGPTGRYEQLLSFSDVADYMVGLPDSFKRKYKQSSKKAKGGVGNQGQNRRGGGGGDNCQPRYSTLRRFLTFSSQRGTSFGGIGSQDDDQVSNDSDSGASTTNNTNNNNTLTRYYRSLMRSYSSNGPDRPNESGGGDGNRLREGKLSLSSNSSSTCDTKLTTSKKQVPKLIQDGALRSIISSSFGDFSELSETNYIPVNMAFIFRNGKIALFEFTESYAIHTREAQLDRYDYSKVVDVTKNGEDFIVTILTVCDKLIKVII